MSTKKKYYDYVLAQPGRALYANITEASKPKTVAEAKTKYSVTLGLEQRDAEALFALEAQAIRDAFGSFTGPDDYQLCVVSGAKAAAKAIAGAEINARGKPDDERFKIMQAAEARAELLKPYAGVMQASSRIAFHDRFLERYTNDLTQAERELADRLGFSLGVLAKPQFIKLNTSLLFQEHKDKFYRGAYIGGAFNLNAWARKKADDKDGVTAYIKSLIFVKDGERLSAERPMEDEFSHYQGVETDYSPSAAAAASDQPKVDAHQF
jgi:hypothetical protein